VGSHRKKEKSRQENHEARIGKKKKRMKTGGFSLVSRPKASGRGISGNGGG